MMIIYIPFFLFTFWYAMLICLFVVMFFILCGESKLYALFGNGRIEEFYATAHGVSLEKREYCSKIAHRLYDMHSMNPSYFKSNEPQLCQILQKWYDISSKVSFKDNKKKSQDYDKLDWSNIQKQLNLQFKYIESQTGNDKKKDKKNDDENKSNDDDKAISMKDLARKFLFTSVFSHNDLLSGNVLHLSDTKVMYKCIHIVLIYFLCYYYFTCARIMK